MYRNVCELNVYLTFAGYLTERDLIIVDSLVCRIEMCVEFGRHMLSTHNTHTHTHTHTIGHSQTNSSKHSRFIVDKPVYGPRDSLPALNTPRKAHILTY